MEAAMGWQERYANVIDHTLQKWATKPPPSGFGIVYIGINKKTHKAYVGLHSIGNGRNKVSVKAARWSKHLKGKSGCTRLINSIKKHGTKAFVWYVIELCGENELDEREAFWIKKLNTISPAGYNLESGGRNMQKHSLETIEAMKVTRNAPGYVSKLKKRRREEWAKDGDRFRSALLAGIKKSDKYPQARRIQWKNKTEDDVKQWVEKHQEIAASKRQTRLNSCKDDAEKAELLKYFKKLDRTTELKALEKAGLHVRKSRGPNTGKSKRRVQGVKVRVNAEFE